VEGYFDVGQLLQAGVTPVVASCGTALTAQQAQLLRRFASKVVVNFDPDAAGQGAAARACELLAAEGIEVNVAVLPGGADPDTFVREHGRAPYVAELRWSVPYLVLPPRPEGVRYDMCTDAGCRRCLNAILAVAAWIPDAAARDHFGYRPAHAARIREEVARTEIRKAAGARRT